jgi:plastocyanin
MFDQPSMDQFDKTGIMNMIKHLFKVALLSAGLAVFGCSMTGSAAVAVVVVGVNNTTTFTPAVTNISVGDQVVWVWNYTSTFLKHSSTSGTNGVPSGLWGSLTNLPPYSFTNTFNSAGTYEYYCGIHFAAPFFMTGAVVVATANLPPTVAITNPASGAVFASPANVTIQAAASDPDGTVTNVQFLIDSMVLANDTVAPFSAVTNNLAAGSYTLSAIASDNSGATATNQVMISVVTPVSVVLSAPALQPAANFQFSYTANAGLSYVIQRSTDLLSNNWIPLATNMAGSSSVTFTDINATVNPAFYRVGLLPNP